MAASQSSEIDVANGFNTFSVEVRSRIETLIKQVLVISGGIQTITISAFLTGNKPNLNENTIRLLEYAWYQLSASMILCLVFMLSQILGLIHVGIQHKNILENADTGLRIVTTWLPLRIFNWVTSLPAFVLCLTGIFTISRAAVSLIGA